MNVISWFSIFSKFARISNVTPLCYNKVLMCRILRKEVNLIQFGIKLWHSKMWKKWSALITFCMYGEIMAILKENLEETEAQVHLQAEHVLRNQSYKAFRWERVQSASKTLQLRFVLVANWKGSRGMNAAFSGLFVAMQNTWFILGIHLKVVVAVFPFTIKSC